LERQLSALQYQNDKASQPEHVNYVLAASRLRI